jgi:hypothetical protein
MRGQRLRGVHCQLSPVPHMGIMNLLAAVSALNPQQLYCLECSLRPRYPRNLPSSVRHCPSPLTCATHHSINLDPQQLRSTIRTACHLTAADHTSGDPSPHTSGDPSPHTAPPMGLVSLTRNTQYIPLQPTLTAASIWIPSSSAAPCT